jgi:hypothetical protein
MDSLNSLRRTKNCTVRHWQSRHLADKSFLVNNELLIDMLEVSSERNNVPIKTVSTSLSSISLCQLRAMCKQNEVLYHTLFSWGVNWPKVRLKFCTYQPVTSLFSLHRAIVYLGDITSPDAHYWWCNFPCGFKIWKVTKYVLRNIMELGNEKQCLKSYFRRNLVKKKTLVNTGILIN